jgi:hypothetical protein
MATGVYGTVRPADMSPADVEMTVFYSENREKANSRVFKLDSGNLVPLNNPNNPSSTAFEIFGGLYNLKLPVTDFGAKGIYTIVFKPVEMRTKIIDCGVLSAYPDIKGLLFDTSDSRISSFLQKFQNNNLIGYRIEYLSTNPSSNNLKVPNFFRIITSNNKAEPVNQNLTNTNQKAIRYRFNDNSNLVFATVSPSSSTSVKPNVLPFIGAPNQEVIITNTFFTPFVMEIEMVEYDIETLAIGMFGNQTKSLEDGIYTVYNFNEDIYKQYNLYEIKDRFSGKPLFEVKENRLNNIDFSKGFDDIANV